VGRDVDIVGGETDLDSFRQWFRRLGMDAACKTEDKETGKNPQEHPQTLPIMIEYTSAGRTKRSKARRRATASTSSARRARNCSPRSFWPTRAPYCAPATPPTISRNARATSTVWFVVECTMVV